MILVAGATGNVGSELVRALVDAGEPAEHPNHDQIQQPNQHEPIMQ
jgi:uncharacterized protein YbjT (DUF2867 family)